MAAALQIECDSYTATVRNGRVFLELRGVVGPAQPEFLTLDDLADKLRLPARAVRRLCQLLIHPLPHERVGVKYRFRPRAVGDWLLSNQSRASKLAFVRASDTPDFHTLFGK